MGNVLMFDHEDIQIYSIEDVPLNRDLFMMDVKWMEEYESELITLLDGQHSANTSKVGFVEYVAANSASPEGIEISWYADTFKRIHSIETFLPRKDFVKCVDCWSCDEKPHIFVKSDWLENLQYRTNSVFAMVDASDMKNALRENKISSKQLEDLQLAIDEISSRNVEFGFVSFADSLLVKTNWRSHRFSKSVENSYDPEKIIRLLFELVNAFRENLNLDAYAIVTQGQNEFFQHDVFHISDAKNHLSLNSLGLPFSQLQSIDSAARRAVRKSLHKKCELYMDQNFFISLKFKLEFDKNDAPEYRYSSSMTDRQGSYICSSFQNIFANWPEN